MRNKTWYASRTLWVNAVAFIALVAQMKYGFVISGEEQVGVLVMANLILRIFTDKGLSK